MRINVGQKIAAGYLLALLIFGAVEFVTYRNVLLFVENNVWVEHTHAVIKNLGGLLSSLQDCETGTRGFLLTGDEEFLEPYRVGVEDASRQVEALYGLISDNPQQQQRMESLENLIGKKISLDQGAIDLRKIDQLASDPLLNVMTAGKQVMDSVREAIDRMIVEENILLRQREERLIRAIQTTKVVIVSALIFSSAFLLLWVFFLDRSISRPLRQIAGVAERIGAGDLSIDIPSNNRGDEVGTLIKGFSKMTAFFRQTAETAERIARGDLTVQIAPLSEEDVLGNSLAAMIASLRDQMQQIREASNALASSSGEISATVAQLASSTSDVAGSINETSTTVEELRQTARLSHEKSDQVAKGSQKAAEVSQEGLKLTEEMIGGMNGIQEQMGLIAESIISLSEQCQAIGEIIASVNDLSEQSNLLAVNAAIEAAKAGEQGKGFVVVAEEIRRLAEGSKEATSQVQNILQDIQKGVSGAVMAVEQGTRAADGGVKQSSETGITIRRLAESMEEASQSVIQIAASSQQQLVGVDQVTDAMSNIRESSTQNSQGARQLEQASRDLSALGLNLEELLRKYSI